MEEIKQLVYNYAKAVHSQNEEEFKALWSSKENILISLANQFNGTDAIYQDFLIGGIQSHYESIDLVVEKIDIRMIDENKAIVVFRYHTECIRRDTHAYSLFKKIGVIRNSYSSYFLIYNPSFSNNSRNLSLL